MESFRDLSTKGNGRRYIRRRRRLEAASLPPPPTFNSTTRGRKRLRAAIDKTPGSDHVVLAITAIPDQYQGAWIGDEPTDTEDAKHAALTFFALDQQSICNAPMHVDGHTLGSAIARRPERPGELPAVRRRFGPLGTATAYDETLFHLRSRIRRLRDEGIPLDCGLLADDTVSLRAPGRPDRVRGRWAREFYRTFLKTNHPPRSNHGSHDH